MTTSYLFWALLGMAGYSFTTLFVKLATKAGLPSSVVVAIATTLVCLGCWSIVVARGQTGLLLRSLTAPAGLWSIAVGVVLTIAVASLFRALELGPASVVVPIYGMFIVGGFALGVLLLDEPLTLAKSIGIAAAVAGVFLISV
jgi:transporter family protein